MSQVRFCPMCSVYLGSGEFETCPKCGSNIRLELDRKQRYEATIKRRSEVVEGPFHPVLGRKCKVCGEDVEILSPKVEEFTVYGKSCGKGPVLGDIKAPMQVFVGFQAWRCRKKHKLFSTYEVENRELCPTCHTPNNPYGNLVRSCPRCSTMVPVDYYVEGDPLELLSKRGYHHDPDLE